MTLPANDAFSLSHDPTRTRLSSSLRSTSPKIPFVSTTHSRSSSYNINPRKTVRPRTTRVTSMGDGTGHSSPTTNGHAHDETTTNDYPASPTMNGTRHTRVRSRSPSHSPSRAVRRKLNKNHQGAVPAPVAVVVARPPSPSVPPIDWEIPRKSLHSSIGFVTLYLYSTHGSPRYVVIVLSMALAVIVPADVLRLNSPAFERVYERCVGFLMRESEKKTTNGVIWYILGVIWVLAMYPLDIAIVSILILSWVDTAASTIGRLWGRYTPPLPRRLPLVYLPLAPRKSLAGFLAGSLTGAIIAAGFWGSLASIGDVAPVWTWEGGVTGTHIGDAGGVLAGWIGLTVISLVSGIVSGVAEALDLGSLDDNLTLPILSGGCLWGFFKCLQYFFS